MHDCPQEEEEEEEREGREREREGVCGSHSSSHIHSSHAFITTQLHKMLNKREGGREWRPVFDISRLDTGNERHDDVDYDDCETEKEWFCAELSLFFLFSSLSFYSTRMRTGKDEREAESTNVDLQLS